MSLNYPMFGGVMGKTVGTGAFDFFDYKGVIAISADFPTLPEVKIGWTYHINTVLPGSDVTDNDPTKTNTGQTFNDEDEIFWNGLNWTLIGADPIWNDDGTDVSTVGIGRNIDLDTGGLKDNDVTVAVALGDGSNTSFNTTNKTIIGSGNEIHGEVDTHVAAASPHSGTAALAGRAGGQTLNGGTQANDELRLDSTSHGTKGNVTIANGTLLKSLTSNYESLVTVDAAIPNKKYVDDAIGTFTLGLIDGFVVRYNTTTAISVSGGLCEANGEYYDSISGGSSHTMTSLVTGFDLHYVYIDDSASTAPAAVIIDSVTEPTFSAAKNGFYNGDDRCIGVIPSQDGVAQLVKINASVNGRNVINRFGRGDADYSVPILASAQNPNGNWQAPNTNASSVVVPVMATSICVSMSNTDSANIITIGANNAQITPSTISRGQIIWIGYEFAAFVGWLTLDSSRNIIIAGEDTNDNALACTCIGYEYVR